MGESFGDFFFFRSHNSRFVNLASFRSDFWRKSFSALALFLFCVSVIKSVTLLIFAGPFIECASSAYCAICIKLKSIRDWTRCKIFFNIHFFFHLFNYCYYFFVFSNILFKINCNTVYHIF